MILSVLLFCLLAINCSECQSKSVKRQIIFPDDNSDENDTADGINDRYGSFNNFRKPNFNNQQRQPNFQRRPNFNNQQGNFRTRRPMGNFNNQQFQNIQQGNNNNFQQQQMNNNNNNNGQQQQQRPLVRSPQVQG